jgi:hypothetical protein
MSSAALAMLSPESRSAVKKTSSRTLRVSEPGDTFEREADNVADSVASGGRVPGWSLSSSGAGLIQRDSSTAAAPSQPPIRMIGDPQAPPAANNYGDMLGKLAEALLATDAGKTIAKYIEDQPIVKDAKDFVQTPAGIAVVGGTAVAAISGLAAAGKGLPAQLPAIPLDKLLPGLSVKVDIEGPLNRPTQGSLMFSFGGAPPKKKKGGPTASEKYRAQTARIAEDLKFGAGVDPSQLGPVPSAEAQQRRAEEKAVESYELRKIGAILQPGATHAPGQFTPLVPSTQPKSLSMRDNAFRSDATSPPGNAAKDDQSKKEEIPVQRKAERTPDHQSDVTSEVESIISSSGRPLDRETRRTMESRIGFDFSKVRIHTDARAAASAKALGAGAYTVGENVVFAAGRFAPRTTEGRRLLAHELIHVVQQSRTISPARSRSAFLAQPPGTAAAARTSPSLISRRTIQRKVAMRDVGKGEQSGFARVPELIARLNTVSTGLTFALTGSDLTYTVKPDGKLSNFDTQMQAFVDQAAVIPLRFTNRHGLLGDKARGFTESVTEDAWSSGYVDIDDLLASSELGLQEVLVHFLRERTATSNYAKRIGSESLNTDPASPGGAAHQAEFDRAHAQGIQAELAVLQDFFSDPTIKLIDHDNAGNILRVYRNSRKDTIRTRLRPGRGADTGVDAIIVEVVTRDGKVHTPEEYKALPAARAASTTSAAASPPSASSAARGSAASP